MNSCFMSMEIAFGQFCNSNFVVKKLLLIHCLITFEIMENHLNKILSTFTLHTK